MTQREQARGQQAPIQSLWIGGRLSTMERLAIASFLANGHSFHLYAYEEVGGVPLGVDLLDAREVIPRNKIFRYAKYESYAAFANLFRYRLLAEKGGYWVDTDVVCLRPFEHASEYVFAGQPSRLAGKEGSGTAPINNCVIKAPRGSEIMCQCYEASAARDHRSLRWGETGPKLLSKEVSRLGLDEYVVDPVEFCPLPWWRWDVAIEPPVSRNHQLLTDRKVLAIHLWNERWRRSGADKDGSYPPGCIYESLKCRYLREISS